MCVCYIYIYNYIYPSGMRPGGLLARAEDGGGELARAGAEAHAEDLLRENE